MTVRSKVLVAVAAGVAVGAAAIGAVLVVGDEDATSEGVIAGCTRSVDDQQSVARRWNEAALAAIRSDFPAPTVHSRNLFHSAAGMWDAWAAYSPDARGVFVDEQHDADDVTAAREQAMSFAAYRILLARYLRSPDAETAVTRLDELMASLCYDRDFDDTSGGSPAALGNRIGTTILDVTLDDGSNEADDYAAPDYAAVNAPLVVADSGTEMIDPNRWQPLELTRMVAQNGLPLDETVQTFVGPHWGRVDSFALPTADGRGLVVDPGPPPQLGDPATDVEFRRSANEVIRYSATLDASDGVTVDISPSATGDVELGTYDARGRDLNPSTGEPYAPAVVAHGDFGRVVAEYWADGPDSETPPGHWNTIANDASDELAARGELRVGGVGEPVDRLEWDTKLYLALDGAAHDAAIAAWGLKGHYDSVRPISMIRYLGGNGQSSDPEGPAYDPEGLLLEPGLVEVVSDESSAPGGRHESLAAHVGEVAVRAWAPSADGGDRSGGVRWILAVDWVPYQRSTFVTPSFAGYVSGHSTFSRAAAEVLTAFTGDEYFPGGLGTTTVRAGELEFDDGPDDDVVLQWATYRDAADQAGVSRLYGGIHVRADDLVGRRIGAEVGRAAWAHAATFFDAGAR